MAKSSVCALGACLFAVAACAGAAAPATTTSAPTAATSASHPTTASAASQLGTVAATTVASISPSPIDIQLALDDLRRGDYAAAEQIAVELASRVDDAQPRAWLIVANARRKLGQYASAARAYRTYLASCDSGDLHSYVMEQIAFCDAAAQGGAVPPPSARLTAQDQAELAAVAPETFTESSEHFVVRSRNARLAKLTLAECEP